MDSPGVDEQINVGPNEHPNEPPNDQAQPTGITIQIGDKVIQPFLNRRGRVITDPSKQQRSKAQLEALEKGRKVLALARQDPNYVSKAGRKLGIAKMSIEDQLKLREERNVKRIEKQKAREEQRQRIVSDAQTIIEKTSIEREELEKQRVEELERIEAIREHKNAQAKYLEEEKKRIAQEHNLSREEKKAEKQRIILDHIQQRITSAMQEIEINRKLEKETRRIEKEKARAEQTLDKHKTPFVFDKKKDDVKTSFVASASRVPKPFVARGREHEY